MKHLRLPLLALFVALLAGGFILNAQEVTRVGKGTKAKAELAPTPTPSPVPQATPFPEIKDPAAVDPQADRDPAAMKDLLNSVGTGIVEGEKREDPALVALGSMGAANLYYSYLTIGSIADGFVSGTYQPRIAISVANEAIFMNETSKTSLVKLRTTGLIAPEDKEAIDFLIATYDILNSQAKSLIKFISDRSDDGMEYQKYRKDAWSRIVTLFGIN